MSFTRLACLLIALCLAGCVGIVQQPTVSREFPVPETPAVAYTRALQTTLHLGGTLWQQDSHQRMLQAFVGTFSERLNVQVYPQGSGSLLVVETQRTSSLVNPGTTSHLAEEFLHAYTTR